MVKFAGEGLRLKIKMLNQNKRSQCTVCKKWMRSDNLKSHSKIHKDILDVPEEKIQIEELSVTHKRNDVEDQDKTSDIQPSVEDLRELLSRNNQLYLEQIELGSNISSILDEVVVREESLTKEHKHALDLNRRQEPRCDISTVQLQP